MFLSSQDLAPWQGKLAVLSFSGGETTTGRILYVDQKRNVLLMDVLSTNRPLQYKKRDQQAYVISIYYLMQVLPAGPEIKARHAMLPIDPCRELPRSWLLGRVSLFLCLIGLLSLIFLFFEDALFGPPLIALLGYSAFASLYSLGGGRYREPPYRLSCPVVRRQLPKIFLRHGIGVTAVLLIVMAALYLHPHLPHWWNSEYGWKSQTPLSTVTSILCIVILVTQSAACENLLERAHLEFSAEDQVQVNENDS